MVQKLGRDQGRPLAVTPKTLWKRLAEKHLLSSSDKNQNTIRKTINGRRRRVIHLASRLRELLKVDPSEPALPRYLIPGRRITKSLVTVAPLDDLVKAYSKQYNVSQKEIYEIALVKFFKKIWF
jgi:hypothetical protein